MQHELIKNYWSGVAIILIAGAFLFYFKFNLPSNEPANLDNAALVINFANGNLRKFEGAVASNMTILEALNSASMGGHFNFRYSVDKNGRVSLASIDKTINVGEKSWHFYLNQVLVPTRDINKTKIRRGDLIEVKYE